MIDRAKKETQLRAVALAKADPNGVVARAHSGGRFLVECSEPGSELVGCAIVGIYSNGRSASSVAYPKDHPMIGDMLFESMVKETLKKRFAE